MIKITFGKKGSSKGERRDDDFDHTKWHFTSTGAVSRDWDDLLSSNNAQEQVKEARKLSKVSIEECQ